MTGRIYSQIKTTSDTGNVQQEEDTMISNSRRRSPCRLRRRRTVRVGKPSDDAEGLSLFGRTKEQVVLDPCYSGANVEFKEFLYDEENNKVPVVTLQRMRGHKAPSLPENSTIQDTHRQHTLVVGESGNQRRATATMSTFHSIRSLEESFESVTPTTPPPSYLEHALSWIVQDDDDQEIQRMNAIVDSDEDLSSRYRDHSCFIFPHPPSYAFIHASPINDPDVHNVSEDELHTIGQKQLARSSIQFPIALSSPGCSRIFTCPFERRDPLISDGLEGE